MFDPASGGITLTETALSTTAHLWGEIDDSLRQQASMVLSRALDRDLPIVLDASRVEFIDSSGIAFLIQLCTIGREEGLDVTLVDAPSVVTEVLALLGLEHMFDQPDAMRPSAAPDTSTVPTQPAGPDRLTAPDLTAPDRV